MLQNPPDSAPVRSFAAYPTSMKPSAQPKPESAQEWDQLRREARKLEAELDVRLAAFGKLCSSLDTSYGSRSETGLATDQLSHSKAAELEEYLKRLSDVNSRLSACLVGTKDSRSHMLTRHRDVLTDYTQEFRRLSATLGTARDRAQLFQGASDSTPLMMDDVMGQAQAVASDLTQQRQLFAGIGDKLLSVAAKYPAVNGLLNAVRRKRSKDTIILSAVIAVCTLFTLIYWWSKH